MSEKISTLNASVYQTTDKSGFLLPTLSSAEPDTQNQSLAGLQSDTALRADDIGLHIFEALVISIGAVGTFANGAVLSVLFEATHEKKQIVNILLINQISLDMFSCFWLVIVYSVKMSDIYLTGQSGFWLCVFIHSESFIWLGLLASIINLVSVAVERYAMIVHPIWHKTHFTRRKVYAIVALAWIYPLAQVEAATASTSIVVNGQCLPLQNWPSYEMKVLFGAYGFVCYYLIALSILIYCYSRILVSIRQQSRVFATQQANNSISQTSKEMNQRIQKSIIKTMIMVSVLFAVCWLPSQLYVFLQAIEAKVNFSTSIYFGTVFVAFFNACLNPFVYAANYEVVRRHLWTCLGNIPSKGHVEIITLQSNAPHVQSN